MRILIARYCWPVVAFEGREVDPALTRARDVIGLSQQADEVVNFLSDIVDPTPS